MNKDQQKTYDEFNDVVNMQPKQLEKWLETEDSKSVGQSDGSGESKGHQSGRRIIEIKNKNKADLDDDDFKHMSKVVSYVKRHSAQRPDGDVSETNWCYSLKNWGHDPTKN